MKKNTQYNYVGIFVDKPSLDELLTRVDRRPLARDITDPHVTLKFRPKEIHEELFGETVRITADGYGCDGRNEGLRVRIESDHPDLMDEYRRVLHPHITLSISEDGKAVDTAHLEFHDIEPFSFTGIYGGYNQKQKTVDRQFAEE